MRRASPQFASACALALAWVPGGCASVANDAQRYERALESLEYERIDDYCTESHSWVPLHPAPDAPDDAAQAAKRSCVVALSESPDRPGRKQARERMLKCMHDAGWELGPTRDGEIDVICLSGSATSPTQDLATAAGSSARMR